MRHLGRHRPLDLGIALVLTFLTAGVTPARAQPADGDIAAAGRAFDEGQRAQLRRDYTRAAELFELADRLAPSAPALRSAIRNVDAAGNAARAATLAAEAVERYPADAETQRLAATTLARLAPTLAALTIRCMPACALELDQSVVAAVASSRHHLFVAPGEHALAARFADHRSETRALHTVAGDAIELALHAAPDLPTPTLVPDASASTGLQRWRRLPPAVPIVGGALTIGLAGVLLWSGLDTLAARDRYVSHPTQAGFDDGVGRERRTDGLIGAVAGLGTITIAVALVGTRWHRHAPRSRD